MEMKRHQEGGLIIREGLVNSGREEILTNVQADSIFDCRNHFPRYL